MTPRTPKVVQHTAEIIKLFEAVDPKNKKYYNNKTQRAAVDFLVEEYTFKTVAQVIKLLPKTNNMQYMPHITTPVQLVNNWVRLRDSLIRKKQELQEFKQLPTVDLR